MTMLYAIPAHEKTVDLRVERLDKAIILAGSIYTGHLHTHDRAYVNRLLAGLLEERALVSAHTSAMVTRIVENVPADQQHDALRRDVTGLNTLILRADLAIARIRSLITDTEDAA